MLMAANVLSTVLSVKIADRINSLWRLASDQDPGFLTTAIHSLIYLSAQQDLVLLLQIDDMTGVIVLRYFRSH